MKATPIFDLTEVNLSLTPAEAQRVIDDPQTIVGVLSAAMAQTQGVKA